MDLVSCNSDSHDKSPRVCGEGPLRKTSDAGEDVVRALGPHERLGRFVAHVDEVPNGPLQLADTAMHPAPKLFRRQFAKPPLDQIQPRAVRRREMDVESRALGQPGANERGFMGAVVIHDEVDVVDLGGHAHVDAIEELAKLDRSLAPMRVRNDRARLRVERGEQRRGPMPRVVVRPALACPGRSGSNGAVRSSA